MNQQRAVLSVEQAREQLAAAHRDLLRWGLVAWTSGNVSARARSGDGDVLVIKPSGVSYDDLTAESMVVATLDGQATGGPLTASSDTAAHAYVYRHMPEAGSVVHTHSAYATAWAARGEPIPCVLTAMADEFGGPVPVGPLAPIGDDSIGRGIVATLSEQNSPAVLMRSHGVFTVGRDVSAAVKAAVMCEDVARTVYLARQLGGAEELSPAVTRQLHERYQNAYGQRQPSPATGDHDEPAAR